MHWIKEFTDSMKWVITALLSSERYVVTIESFSAHGTEVIYFGAAKAGPDQKVVRHNRCFGRNPAGG